MKESDCESLNDPKEFIPLAESGEAKKRDDCDQCCCCWLAGCIIFVALFFMGAIIGSVYFNGKVNLDVFTIDLKVAINGMFIIIMIMTCVFGAFKLHYEPRIHEFSAKCMVSFLFMLMFLGPVPALSFAYVVTTSAGVYYAVMMLF